MSRRLLTWGTVGVAGAGAYYLYNAGGDPKVAEKQFEHDASRVSAKVRGELPGKEKEAKTAAETYKQQAESKFNSAFDDAKVGVNKADARAREIGNDASKKFEEYRKETGKELNSAVDKFDKSVSEGATKSKSWIGSWFGGK